MKALINLFKPAPFVEPIQDKEEVDRSYRYWRVRILYSMFFGYAFYYFTRMTFTFAMPGMIEEFGFDKSQLGMLASIFSLSYGFSKFGSGILSDRSNPRYFMAFGLIVTGVVNILFGMTSSLLWFAIFWGLNGFFQGFGWPPCARLLRHWYSQNERGSWWSTWNVSHNVGAFLIPWIVGACLLYWDWRLAMYIPGVICIFGGVFLFSRLRDTPQSLGLPPVEVWRNDDLKSSVNQEKELSTKELLFEYVLKNPYIWMLAFAYFFIYVVRMGVNQWTALFLIESKQYSLLGANGCVSLFEVGGFFGSLAAGWSSDRLFGARRGPVNVVFAVGMFASIFLFWLIPPGYALMDSVLMFFVGFFIFGPQMMVGIAAAELSHKKAAATSTGFVGWVAYIGAAVAGQPLGKVIQEWGWQGFFWGILFCCAITTVLLLPLWGVTGSSSSKKAAVAPEEPEVVEA